MQLHSLQKKTTKKKQHGELILKEHFSEVCQTFKSESIELEY